MLKLKRVEIQGFKSFYERTEMKFNGSGIAAVVGPNGCGKSNLSDAISWVLGEQSAKTLRGSRMEDVIFAGTRDKKALGMASVTMTLVPQLQYSQGANLETQTVVLASADAAGNGASNGFHHEAQHADAEQACNANGPGNGHIIVRSEADRAAEKTGEITITRRLYRSGESEYLINGKQARLRDIQDLFLGTGLGPESYAIIEQGRIGQILSNRPQDRRAVIEEAAGITRFKTRKRLAEAKLESAKQNLSRVFDILEEVTRQVNTLKRQAAKTKRYAELRAEGTGYLRQLLTTRFSLLEREMAKIVIELNLASNELQETQKEVTAREANQSSVLEASYATEQELTAARKGLADIQVEAERARGRLEYQTKQISQIDNRVAGSEQEMTSLNSQVETRASELEQQAAALSELEIQCRAAGCDLECRTAQRQSVQSQLSTKERELEAARQRVLRFLGESAALNNRITQMEAQIASADRDTARAQAEEQQSQADLARLQKLRADLSERLSARQTELISVTDQRQALEQDLHHDRLALNDSRQAVDRARSDHSRVKARKDSLEDVLQHRSYTTETVKRLFTAIEQGRARDFKPVGVLADFLEVDPQFEKATEEFLHDELEYVVVRDWADAERGMELMRTEINGRATFLVESGEASDASAQTSNIAAQPGVITRLSDTLRFTNGLTNVPLHLMPRIANCYVASDRAAARELAPRFPECWFLTPDGANYHGLAVSGGNKSGAGPLALKRELRDLTQLEDQKATELGEAQQVVADLERAVASITEDLEHVRSKQQAQEKDVLALDHESRKIAEEFGRVQSRLSRARLELERITGDRVNVQQKLATDHASLLQTDQVRAAEEQGLESAREQLTGLQQELANANEDHAATRAQLASLEERRRAIADNTARLEGQVRDLTNRRDHLSADIERLTSERIHLVANNEQLTAAVSGMATRIATTQETVDRLAAREHELREQLAASEEELKRLRQDAHSCLERRSELQVLLARAESDMAHLAETCQKELEADIHLLKDEVEIVQDETTLVELDKKYSDIRRNIESLGPVNPQALEEHEEAQQRQDFLNAQRQDLLDSIRDTEKAIHEIDGESRKRFSEAFKAINDNFREMFRTLFGGGIGEMRLTDEENISESGIDIVASPPGKKLQSVLLLSGGEKSLTAMALLMSIFQYTPSPFCILDEVDAPLDEPNIERLTRLLKEMAEQTQFIVITHAKRTMEAAESLYGVTMQEPGISKLVSVKFNQPESGPHIPPAQDVKQAEMESALA